jgi:hypothetical protein
MLTGIACFSWNETPSTKHLAHPVPNVQAVSGILWVAEGRQSIVAAAMAISALSRRGQGVFLIRFRWIVCAVAHAVGRPIMRSKWGLGIPS